MKKFRSLLIMPMLVVMGMIQAQPDDGKILESKISEHITHADTYYWFGMEEKGDLRTFGDGLSHLDQADSLLEIMGADGPAYAALSKQSEALRTDLENQIVRGHDRFTGTFPLTNLLGYNFFTDQSSPGTYEMIDDPRVTGAINSINNLANEIVGKWGREPQIDVVFTSIPNDAELENEALYVFNQSTKYFVHNKKEVRGALDDGQMRSFERGEMSSQMKDRLIDSFNSPTLLMVVVKRLDLVDNAYFYLAEGHAYNSGSSSSIRSFFTMGFSRDGRDLVNQVLIFVSCLFLIGMLVYHGVNYRKNQSGYRFGVEGIYIPLTYFMLGMVLPFLVEPLISTIKPDAESFSRVSFWWPMLMGVSLLGGPTAVILVASTRLGKFLPGLLTGSKGGATVVMISLGSLSYLSVPMILAGHTILSVLSLSTVLAVGCSGYLFGLAVDRVERTPVEYALISLILFGGIGLGVCMLDPRVIHLLVVIAVMSIWFENRRSWGSSNTDQDGELDIESGSMGSRIDPTRFSEPDYLQLSYYHDEIEAWVNDFNGQRETSCLTLLGNSGVGKTATADHVAKKLSSELGEELIVLTGKCSEPLASMSGSTSVFKPFKEALENHFHINLLGTDDQKMEQIEGAMGAVFNSVLPVAGVFLPAVTPEENRASTKTDIFNAVWKMLKDLSSSKTVLIYIDDIQWIDMDSLELLDYLIQKMEKEREKRSSGKGLTFMLTGRSEDSLPLMTDELAITLPETKITLKGPTDEERASILEQQLGFKRSAAKSIVSKAKAGTESNGGMFWVIQIIIQLAQEGLLRETESGIDLTIDPGSIPIPSDMQDALEAQLDLFPEFIPLLECAACLGKQFSATVLSDSLELDRLETLSRLKEIEERSGIIKDIRQSDDQFEFHSSFMLNTIRTRLSISGSGPASTDVPQIIREYHQRASLTLQKQYASGRSDVVFALADHHYAAGMACVVDAFGSCMDAAHASVGSYNFKQAFHYLDLARECGQLAGLYKHQSIEGCEMEGGRDSTWLTDALSRDIWSLDEVLICCEYSHVTHKYENKIAKLAEAYLLGLDEDETNDNRARLLVATTRALYDAEQYKKAEEYATKLIETSLEDSQRATGMQLKGLSMVPSDLDGRVSLLEQAHELVSKMRDRSTSEERLYGRILNSLGSEYLNFKDDEDRQQKGLALLRERVESNEKNNLGDMQGMAFTHGAMARYHLYQTRDMDSARANFTIDLELSIELGDVQGQSQMHSHLGECDAYDQIFDGAMKHYASAIELAEEMDESGFRFILFPCTGYLDVCMEKNDQGSADIMGVKLYGVFEQFNSRLGHDEFIVKKIRSSLDSWNETFTGDWVQKLKIVIDGLKTEEKK